MVVPRPEVATRAAECLHELTIYFKQIGIGSPVKIDSQFDEFNLGYDIHYGGPPIRFPDEPPSLEAIASEVEAMPLLSAYILRGSTDGISVSSQSQQSRIHLHFDH